MKKASTAGIQQSRAQFVRQKSVEALQRWKGSETDRQSSYRSRKHSKVQFCPGTVLLLAVSVGDIDEVKLLVKSNAESINFQNVDGLTPLHQVLSYLVDFVFLRRELRSIYIQFLFSPINNLVCLYQAKTAIDNL